MATAIAQRAGAMRLHLVLCRLIDRDDVRVELWDGSATGPMDALFTVRMRSPHALDRLLGARPERGFGRAYAEGLIDIDPLDRFVAAVAAVDPRRVLAAAPGLMRAALALGGRPDFTRSPDAEAHLRGRRHTPERDGEAIRHHYDLPVEFYALWLDPTLTYSCAYFATPDDSLDDAQTAKLDLVCRKLRLRAGESFLDVGCGWGSLPIFAAQNYGVRATGITLSPAQADVARRRVAEAGLAGQVEIELGDYRDVRAQYDAVATVGMVEHVGRERMDLFARALHDALHPGGRLLLHGITLAPHVRWSRHSFLDAFIFPDGELEEVTWRDGRMQMAGLELRDVEALREHYALTLREWMRRLEARWDEAVALVGEERARVWRLYFAGSMAGFDLETISIHQSLFVRPDAGRSGLPLRRDDWYAGQDRLS